jgi:hypothetical protein
MPDTTQGETFIVEYKTLSIPSSRHTPQASATNVTGTLYSGHGSSCDASNTIAGSCSIGLVCTEEHLLGRSSCRLHRGSCRWTTTTTMRHCIFECLLTSLSPLLSLARRMGNR